MKRTSIIPGQAYDTDIAIDSIDEHNQHAIERTDPMARATAPEYLIHVYDNDDNDTGIWHKGSNVVDLVDRAAASVADVYDTEVTKVTQGISGGFVDRDGRTYRYQAHLI